MTIILTEMVIFLTEIAIFLTKIAKSLTETPLTETETSAKRKRAGLIGAARSASAAFAGGYARLEDDFPRQLQLR